MFEPKPEWITPAEYLQRERGASTKSEYFHGEVFAMAGATPEHNLVVANVIRELGNQLADRPCQVYSSDQRVKVPDTGLYCYPDVTVVCGDPEFDEADPNTLTNPTLLVEVLSDSTEAFDRGDKFAHYRRLDSLREYVLVATDHRRVERFTRQGGEDTWLFAECRDDESALALVSISAELTLPSVYRKVMLRESRRRGPSV